MKEKIRLTLHAKLKPFGADGFDGTRLYRYGFSRASIRASATLFVIPTECALLRKSLQLFHFA